jgi:hypothetical protein
VYPPRDDDLYFIYYFMMSFFSILKHCKTENISSIIDNYTPLNKIQHRCCTLLHHYFYLTVNLHYSLKYPPKMKLSITSAILLLAVVASTTTTTTTAFTPTSSSCRTRRQQSSISSLTMVGGMDTSGNSWKPDSEKMGSTDTGDYFPEGYNPEQEIAFSSGMMGSQASLGNDRGGPQLPGLENLGADAVVAGTYGRMMEHK